MFYSVMLWVSRGGGQTELIGTIMLFFERRETFMCRSKRMARNVVFSIQSFNNIHACLDFRSVESHYTNPQSPRSKKGILLISLAESLFDTTWYLLVEPFMRLAGATFTRGSLPRCAGDDFCYNDVSFLHVMKFCARLLRTIFRTFRHVFVPWHNLQETRIYIFSKSRFSIFFLMVNRSPPARGRREESSGL